jgi:hypothetical protein
MKLRSLSLMILITVSASQLVAAQERNYSTGLRYFDLDGIPRHPKNRAANTR